MNATAIEPGVLVEATDQVWRGEVGRVVACDGPDLHVRFFATGTTATLPAGSVTAYQPVPAPWSTPCP